MSSSQDTFWEEKPRLSRPLPRPPTSKPQQTVLVPSLTGEEGLSRPPDRPLPHRPLVEVSSKSDPGGLTSKPPERPPPPVPPPSMRPTSERFVAPPLRSNNNISSNHKPMFSSTSTLPTTITTTTPPTSIPTTAPLAPPLPKFSKPSPPPGARPMAKRAVSMAISPQHLKKAGVSTASSIPVPSSSSLLPSLSSPTPSSSSFPPLLSSQSYPSTTTPSSSSSSSSLSSTSSSSSSSTPIPLAAAAAAAAAVAVAATSSTPIHLSSSASTTTNNTTPPTLPPHIKLLAPTLLPGSPPAVRAAKTKVPVSKGPRKKFPDAPAPQLPSNIPSSTTGNNTNRTNTPLPEGLKEKILLKIKIPTKDTVKTVSFSLQNSVEEALAIIAKKLQLQQEEIKSNDFGLFIPSRGEWFESNKKLIECELQDLDEVSFLPRKRTMVHLAMAHGRPQRPLFDYAIIVQFSASKELQVLYQFPQDKSDPLISSVPQFCFPDKESLDIDTITFANEESFSFALTSNDGERRLGYCRRILGRPTLCYCVVSALQSFELFKHILTQVVERYDSLTSTEAVTEFLKAVYEKPFPLLGETFSVKVTNPFTQCPESVQFTYDHDSQLEFVDLQTLLQQMQPEYLLTIFTLLMIERRVIFYSENVTTLSACVQAVVAMLFPLNWQHIYVPVLPPSILSYCCAPMPFVVGVLKNCINEIHKLPMDEVLLVDLDAGKLYMTNSDSQDYELLPSQIQSVMVKPLRKLQGTVKKVGNSANVSAKTKEKIKKEKKKLLDVFQSFFVSALAFYRDHIKENGDYDKEGFIAARSPDTKAFFDNFVMTQMFERFIEERAFRNPAFNDFEKVLAVFESQFAAKSGHGGGGGGHPPKLAKGVTEILKHDWNFLLPKK